LEIDIEGNADVNRFDLDTHFLEPQVRNVAVWIGCQPHSSHSLAKELDQPLPGLLDGTRLHLLRTRTGGVATFG
jgi:hypothetical protein